MSPTKRSIFEEVDAAKPVEAPVAPTGMIDDRYARSRPHVAIWLAILFVMVAAMILLGGLTRLTDSGLSITEWKPVSGALPPTSAAVWEEEFTKYKTIPEYQLVNKDMTLAEFKRIYWWEWGHRQLGRLVGLVWFIGFVWFVARGAVARGWIPRLAFVGVLGGLQGVVGWWMVSSGLTGRMVDVASYRLATHLGLAFVILGFLAWFYWQMRRPEMDLFQAHRRQDARLRRLASILLAVAFLQILLGALVAGIDAGRGYIDWPLMGGQFLPSESFDYTPFWSNFFENPALVQFNHRMLGYVLVLLGGFVWWQSRSSAHHPTKTAFSWAVMMIFGQMVIGIVTVLYAAPLGIAIIHQFGAILCFCLILYARFMASYPPKQSLKAG